VRWLILVLFVLASPLAAAKEYRLGSTGWQVERLSDAFVVLRTEIFEIGGKQERKGLLVLTCDRQARRIRFQLGGAPERPSLEAEQNGHAGISGLRPDQAKLKPLYPRVRFFPDGSFEILEATGLSEPSMSGFIALLQWLPTTIEVVLYRGAEAGTTVRGITHLFKTEQLEASLVSIYGFEGLCYRRTVSASR
jgi:hypothetical protein